MLGSVPNSNVVFQVLLFKDLPFLNVGHLSKEQVFLFFVVVGVFVCDTYFCCIFYTYVNLACFHNF